MITSRDNEKLKLVRKLADRRWRDKLGLFVAEGEDLVDAAREAGLEPVELLVAGENVEPKLLAQVSQLAHPPRVVGVFRRDFAVDQIDLPRVGLALWRVGDPGNIGTLFRAADAFGAFLALSDGCADPLGPKALRASMGAVFRVPQAPFETPGRRIALVPHGGTPLDALLNDASNTLLQGRKGATFVLGAERAGLPEDVVAQCDALATIPIRSESLNVAIAGAIALYEATTRV